MRQELASHEPQESGGRRKQSAVAALLGVHDGQWLFALKIYYEALANLTSSEAQRLFALLTPAAFDRIHENREFLRKQGIAAPPQAILCMRRLSEEPEPYSSSTAAEDAGCANTNADRGWKELKQRGLFFKTQHPRNRRLTLVWASTDVDAISQRNQRSAAVLQSTNGRHLNLPSNGQRSWAVTGLVRKAFLQSFAHFEVHLDPDLEANDEYCAALAEAAREAARIAYATARAAFDERAEAIRAMWRTNGKVITGEVASAITSPGGEVNTPEKINLSGARTDSLLTKETTKETRSSCSCTPASSSITTERVAAAAAGGGSTEVKTSTGWPGDSGLPWTQTIAAMRAKFPGLRYLAAEKLALHTRAKYPEATDGEIACAVGLINKRRKFTSEGLYFTVITDFIEEGIQLIENEEAERQRFERAQAERDADNARQSAESRARLRAKLRDPATPAKERLLILRDFPADELALIDPDLMPAEIAAAKRGGS